MTRYYLELSFIVSGYRDADELEAHLDCVADCLPELHGVIDPDLGADLAEGTVTFTMGVDAGAQPEALERAQSAIRTAIHAGKGCTAGWEGRFRDGPQVITPSELTSA